MAEFGGTLGLFLGFSFLGLSDELRLLGKLFQFLREKVLRLVNIDLLNYTYLYGIPGVSAKASATLSASIVVRLSSQSVAEHFGISKSIADALRWAAMPAIAESGKMTLF